MIRHNKNVSIILVIIIIINIICIINIVNKKVRPIIIDKASYECKNIVTLVSNDVVQKEINTNYFDKLFIYSNENIIDIDTVIINKLQTTIVNNIIYNLKCIEDGNISLLKLNNKDILANRKKIDKGIIAEVPITLNYNNIILTNLSPKIPIKFTIIDNVESNIDSNIKEYGINNALIEIFINIKIRVKIILPITSDYTDIYIKIPIVNKIINGKVPEYFSNGDNSKISIPIE